MLLLYFLVVVVGGVVVAVAKMCLVCSCISMSILAPCLTNQVRLGVPRKRSGQVLGEEAARRCCGRMLLKGVAKMYRRDDLTKGERKQNMQKGRGEWKKGQMKSLASK